jgi:branched-subunit amino acid transport protein
MTWIVILAVGLGSYVFRVGPQLLFERTSLSAGGDRMIRHAGTAALTALARGGSSLRLLACGAGVYALSTIVMGLFAG